MANRIEWTEREQPNDEQYYLWFRFNWLKNGRSDKIGRMACDFGSLVSLISHINQWKKNCSFPWSARQSIGFKRTMRITWMAYQCMREIDSKAQWHTCWRWLYLSLNQLFFLRELANGEKVFFFSLYNGKYVEKCERLRARVSLFFSLNFTASCRWHGVPIDSCNFLVPKC